MKLSGKIGKLGMCGIAVVAAVGMPLVMGMTKDPVKTSGPGATIPEALLPAGSTSDGTVTASVTYTLGFTSYSFDPAGNDGEETLSATPFER